MAQPYRHLRPCAKRAFYSLLLIIALALYVGQSSSKAQEEQNSKQVKATVGQSLMPGAGSETVTARDALPGDAEQARLSEIGRGKGIIFSPDLSVPTNRRFYERLGFAYFEDADWRNVIRQVRARNQLRPNDPLKVLIIESHGTNGNGLKLQAGHERGARRSYISVGALQEQLDATGVRLCVITACNAGRLFRPAIYKMLDTQTRDPLFLPATLGIVNASSGYDPARSVVGVLYPAKSALETTNEGEVSELAPLTRRMLETDEAIAERTTSRGSGPVRFVVSDILVQLLLRDPRLLLRAGGYVTAKSSENFTNKESEELFQSFLAYLDEVALRQYKLMTGSGSSLSISGLPQPK
jgi:hypothetical protein